MKTTWVSTAGAAAAICLWAVGAQAVAGDVKPADQAFINQANQIDLTEVTLGKIAQQNGSSNVVKKFGERMVRDHSRMNEGLRAIARSENIVLRTGLNQKDQQFVAHLSALKGRQFDRAYTKDMVADHKAGVAKFAAEAEYGSNRQVKSWAAKWCPTLEEHLRLAQKALKQAGGV